MFKLLPLELQSWPSLSRQHSNRFASRPGIDTNVEKSYGAMAMPSFFSL